jgi:hypothetical protein
VHVVGRRTGIGNHLLEIAAFEGNLAAVVSKADDVPATVAV